LTAPRRSKRRTVLGRVLLSYAAITVCFALAVGYSVLGQRASVRETEVMRSGYIPLIVALRGVVASQNTFNSQLNNITEVRNPAGKRVWFETNVTLGRPKAFAELRAALALAFSSESESLGRALSAEASAIERYLDEDRETLARLFDALKQDDLPSAEELRDQLVSRGNEALRQLLSLENRVNVHLDELMEAISRRERWTFSVLIIWALLSVALGVGMAFYVQRVLRPLARIAERASAVSRGELIPQRVVATNDEIGELAIAFEAMVAGIAQANRKLLESERLATIGKMAAHVTHEVRNPLSSIALNLELLNDELEPGSEAQTLHAAIGKEVDRLTELTEQYLSLTRRNRPRFEHENLGDVVAEAVEFLRLSITRAGAQLQLEVDESLPNVWLDEAQIRQVVHNLVRNARQAMPEGGRLRVAVQAVTDGVQLVIEDEGTGITPDVRQRLFEPFLTTKEHGTGLGLAISKQIVDAHGGSIRCEDNEPRGTRIVIEFPLEPPTATALEADSLAAD